MADQPSQEARPKRGLPSRIILCLSGGGLRATYFHLGVLRGLYEAKLLNERIADVVSISGGSITAAHLALNWTKYTGSADEFKSAEQNLLSLRRWDLSGRAIRRSILTGPFQYLPKRLTRFIPEPLRRRRIQFLRADYNKFFTAKTFNDFPEPPYGPRFHLMATGFARGRPCAFTREGYSAPALNGASIPTQKIEVATAVAASSAFPPVFGPIIVKNTDFGQSDPIFSHSLHDGGVYDNSGIETARSIISSTKTAELVIVSDAGKPFENDDRREFRSMLSLALRTIDILMYRVARTSEAEFERDFGEKILQISIDQVSVAGLPGVVQGALPLIRTDLDAFSASEANALVLHGWAAARDALRAKFGDTIGFAELDRTHLENELPDNDALAKRIFNASRRKWWKIFNISDWAMIPFVAALALAVSMLTVSVVLFGSSTFKLLNLTSDSQQEIELRRLTQERNALVRDAASNSQVLEQERANSARLSAELAAARTPPTRPTCRIAANGVERYTRSFPVTRDSGWRGGGSNPQSWCNVVLTQVRAENPGARVEITAPQEDSKDSCPPFNCRQYKYTCTVVVEADPIYREAASDQCPRQ